MGMNLDQIREAANAKYGHFAVDIDENTTVLLRNTLQLSEDERKVLTADEDDEGNEITRTPLEHMRHLVRIVADSPEGAERIVEAFGENLAYYSHLIGEYNKATQAGEA